MKYFLAPFILILIFSSCSNMEKQAEKTNIMVLDNHWQFRNPADAEWLSATVPGTVHTDLLENGVIEDPYYRTNEKDLQWIDKTDWEYQCSFTVEREMRNKEEIELVFEGLDTYADVYLNGNWILQADNMFRTWTIPCKEFLKKGPNTLRVVLKSPTNLGLELLEANGYPLPASNDQSENGEMGENRVSIFTRKAGYHYGWDWGPRLVTSGIWRPVKLVGYNTAKIEDVHFVLQSVDESKAVFVAEVQIDAKKPFDGRLEIEVDKTPVKSEELSIRDEKRIYKLRFEINDPERWWPKGLGKQKLYDVEIKLINSSDPRKPILGSIETSTGIREIKLIREKDEKGDGESFYFEVNGKPVFAKGANYIPNDVFLTRFKPGDYERIVKDAAEANMNMLRVWGGGIYENDIFYDLCDKYGIMVWQDFMYACSMYPGDDAFLDNARIEAEENIKRLRNHPSLALWCGNNEIEVAWAEYEEDRGWGWKQLYTAEQRKEIWKSYDTLFHHILPDAVTEFNPQIAYWHSSPSAGMGKLAGYENTSGDMHYWGVWHGQHPFSDFRKYKARFMSEYGFQSFPDLYTVSTYALAEEWDIESEVMAAHQRSGIGNLRIKQYMEDHYVIPENFNEFLYVSQLLQAEGIKMAIESHRTDMPYCMGSLYWQLNDCWPVASWSGIDYYGRWKALHYFVKNAFQQTILTTFEEDGNVNVHLVTDALNDHEYELEVIVIDFSGNLIYEEAKTIQAAANTSMPIGKYALSSLAGIADLSQLVMVSRLKKGENTVYEDLHYFVAPRDLQLPEIAISMEILERDDIFEIRLLSDKLAKNVYLNTELSNDHFSDNYFDLLPGVEKTISYPKSAGFEEFKKSLKVLNLQQTMQ